MDNAKRIEYDYMLQAWIIDGIIQDCGHPDEKNCGCSGRRLRGQSSIARAEGREVKP